MIRSLLKFSIQHIGILIVFYIFQRYVIYVIKDGLILKDLYLHYVYAIICALGIFIFVGLILLQKYIGEILGFVFLAGSFLKFGVFFAFLYPIYALDGDISPLEFSSFFIPYSISIIHEVLYLVQYLNKQ